MKKIITSVVALLVMGSVSFAQDAKKAAPAKATKTAAPKAEKKAPATKAAKKMDTKKK